MPWDDRFHGEPSSPPFWENCEYCGGKIYEGQEYYLHHGLCICTDCAKSYALQLFLDEAETRVAEE